MPTMRMQRSISFKCEEIKERYGDVPNVEMECNECVIKYTTDMKEACPEWDKECKMNQ